jgi:two-component system LytT family response regulator
MKKFTVAIIDDEKEARVLLKTLISKYEFLELTITSGNAEQALLDIMKTPPDLIFLDIHMPNKDGFELVKEIQRMRLQSQVVFVTAYNSYAIKAIKINAFDYLLKPIDPDELEDTLIRYHQKLLEADHFRQLKQTLDTFQLPRRVKFNTSKGFLIVNTRNILYLQQDKQEMHLFLMDGTRQVLETGKAELLEKLPSKTFVAIDPSTYVNTEYLSRVNVTEHTCELSFENSNISLPISSEKLADIENAIDSQVSV